MNFFGFNQSSGFGDYSNYFNNQSNSNQQDPTTDDVNQFNEELSALFGNTDLSGLGNTFNIGTFGSSSNFGDMFQLGGSSGLSGMGSMSGMFGSMGSMEDIGGMFDSSSENNPFGDLLGSSSSGSFDMSTMISGFMSMIMGFFSSMMGMFSEGSMNFGSGTDGEFNFFGGVTNDSEQTDVPENADDIDPDSPDV